MNLNVYDITGREYKIGDWIFYKGGPHRVFYAIKSFDNDGYDYIFFYDADSIGGWKQCLSDTIRIINTVEKD